MTALITFHCHLAVREEEITGVQYRHRAVEVGAQVEEDQGGAEGEEDEEADPSQDESVKIVNIVQDCLHVSDDDLQHDDDDDDDESVAVLF